MKISVLPSTNNVESNTPVFKAYFACDFDD